MKITRRKLFVTSALVGTGLVIGFALRGKSPIPKTVANSYQPNAWLQLTDDGRVIFQLDKTEMGQGVYTSLTTILAEELDFDPANIEVQLAPPHPAYGNPAMGGIQATGGSSSLTTSYEPLRNAGATARWLLVSAAAERWGVSADSCTTDNGWVINANGDKLAYAELVDAAGDLTPPESVTLKQPESFKWLGKSQPRFDSREKIAGATQFGMDIQLPNMKVAVVVRCPHFGGELLEYDASAAGKMAGVSQVFTILNGIAIVADGYWQARQAAEKIKPSIQWNKGPLASINSATIAENQDRAMADEDSIVDVVSEGEDPAVVAAADANTVIEAQYSAPFLAHNTMEPQNCSALVEGDRCTVWAPSQAAELAKRVAQDVGGFEAENITIHSTFVGGGFGRRAMVDFVGEVVAIAKQQPGTPIKLIWSREDDIQHDYYRPSTRHRLSGVVNSTGDIVGWQHRMASASIVKGFAGDIVKSYLPGWLPETIGRGLRNITGNLISTRDPTMWEGTEIPYTVANKKVDLAFYDPGIPIGFWRSVGHSHNAFVVESFFDELAHTAGKDPVALRRRYLSEHPRHLNVLNKVAEAADWGNVAAGIFQGVAVHESFDSYVAEVVEISLTAQGYKIERVVCAVDCGRVIDPNNVIAQIESGVIYGLTAALKAPVTINEGAVVESNFHNLPAIRMNEAPPIKVVFVDSDEHPTGVGEISVPPLAPALANAIFAATGQRLRDLPLTLAPA